MLCGSLEEVLALPLPICSLQDQGGSGEEPWGPPTNLSPPHACGSRILPDRSAPQGRQADLRSCPAAQVTQGKGGVSPLSPAPVAHHPPQLPQGGQCLGEMSRCRSRRM